MRFYSACLPRSDGRPQTHTAGRDLQSACPTIANACEMAATIPSAPQHPFPCIPGVVQQPMDLHRGLGIMKGDSIVEPATVNNELRYAFMEFPERIGEGQGRRRELPGSFVNEAIIS